VETTVVPRLLFGMSGSLKSNCCISSGRFPRSISHTHFGESYTAPALDYRLSADRAIEVPTEDEQRIAHSLEVEPADICPPEQPVFGIDLLERGRVRELC
jgi:hypothetical protein